MQFLDGKELCQFRLSTSQLTESRGLNPMFLNRQCLDTDKLQHKGTEKVLGIVVNPTVGIQHFIGLLQVTVVGQAAEPQQILLGLVPIVPHTDEVEGNDEW